MFKRDSYKAKMREIGQVGSGSASRPAYKQKTELVRTKRCRSNNSSQNKRQLITVIDNFIHKINDRRKASLSDSASTSASSTDSTKANITSRIKDSPRLILKSTQNYIRSFKRPCQTNSLRGEKETRSDLFFDHFSSNRVEELQNSSILKSLLDSQQYLMLQKSLSQSNFNESSSSENSNASCIIHDCSDDSDSNSNQTFVEHSDESYTTCEQTDETKNQTLSAAHQTDGYKFLLAKLHSSYLKSPNSIVNKVQIPNWMMELANFREDSIQWESLDLKSLELYDLMLQRIHKNELMSLIEKHEVYRTQLNEMLASL